MSAVHPAASRRSALRREPAGALAPAELAWLALLPCALVTVCAIVLLGPPLGHLLVRPGPYKLWPPSWWNTEGSPEPHEQGRYLLAAIAPLALAAVVLVRPRAARTWSRHTVGVVVATSQLAVVAFVAIAVLGQNDVLFVDVPTPSVFGPGTFVAAVLLLLAVGVALRGRARSALERLAHEQDKWRAVCLAIATLVASWWMLRAIRTDRLYENIGLFNWTMNDAFAVLDGRTPLVDFRPVYGKLVPYPAALALAIFGTRAVVYTLAMALLSALALVGVYAVYRRVTRSSLLALGLFVPFVATGALGETTIMPALWPMRYGSAYLLAWLTARSLDGDRPRRVATLSFVGTLAVVNNSEFGLAALLATVAALACARRLASRRAVLSLAVDAAGGVLAAVAAVCALTLVRAGALPDLASLTEWPRIFVGLGWFSLPMPAVGLHLVAYATFAAAIVTAAVRVRQGERGTLTGMLAWSGVFGMVAGSYFVGRSDEVKLYSLLSAWSFALGLLVVVVVSALAARGWRSPSPAQLLVLLGFAASACSLGRMPSPADQIAHFTQERPPIAYRIAMERFIAQRTRRDDTVAILVPEGYRLAYDLGLRNVSPYGIENAIVTHRQLQTLLDVARRERVARIFVPQPGAMLTGEGDTPVEHLREYAAAGYAVRSAKYGVLELARD